MSGRCRVVMPAGRMDRTPLRTVVSNPVCVSLLAAERAWHHDQRREDRRMLHSLISIFNQLKHPKVSILA
jgi:hypothetical protein